MADNFMLIFQMKSKFRRKITHLCLLIAYFFVFLCISTLVDSSNSCSPSNCVYGSCENDTCVCSPGWIGKSCDACGGRAKLTSPSGYITDGASNYTVNVKCTWLLDTGRPNSTLRLRFLEFATECGWDHLYIYDGSSVYDPLVAVFSGLVRNQVNNVTTPLPEVKASSGHAYLYFYSDAAYNMSGFNISYSVDSCPQNCSNNGVCNTKGECACTTNFTGPSCSIPTCPNNCAPNGNCNNGKCVCKTGFTGIDCSISSKDGSWAIAPSRPLDPRARGSHKTVVDGTWIYVVGGYDLSLTSELDISRFHAINQQWENVKVDDEIPPTRYGHSLVLYKNKIYMFGGDVLTTGITNELWVFDVPTASPILPITWSLINSSSVDSLPIGVVGHTAHVVGDKMYIIFGYSPVYGYMNFVQEYEFDQDRWRIAQTTGAIVKGGYGHSSVYHPATETIFVHAGYLSGSTNLYILADTLYSYQPKSRKWTILHSSGQFKYLHSAAIIGDVMLVYGGNTHNDTHKSSGAKCYSSDFMAYDIKCDRWHFLPRPKLPQDVSRFGHTADVYQGKTMYLFGGFNGVMLNDVLVYTPGKCSSYPTNETCLSSLPGQSCVWVRVLGCRTKLEVNTLAGLKSISAADVSEHTCTPHKEDLSSICAELSTCPSCLTTTYQCNWCDSRCSHMKCNKDVVRTIDLCPANVSHNCSMLHQCLACQTELICKWEHIDKQCSFVGEHFNLAKVDKMYRQICTPSCEVHTGCETCTTAGCMWCASQGVCVGSNAYVAMFPYGQCLEWTTQISKCSDTRCEDARMCEDCFKNPMCGWCSDGSNTGLGQCQRGGDKGAYTNNTNGIMTLNQAKCPDRRWHFTECPICQCNGHSTCYPKTDVCINCVDLTQGDKCQECQDWYYGTATNGGNCTMCECNNQADTCNRFTGKCHCRTRGVIGDKCNLCDEGQKYFGNPRGGTCYYNLALDYQFTFNLSKKDDQYYTHINFLNIPLTPDRDVDFSINCSDHALLNVTVKTKEDLHETVIMSEKTCSPILKEKFSHSKFSFGSEKNTTFFVYVYDFNTPVTVQISFSQFPKIDLIQFFVTFFSCFLSLLLIAALFWKVKQRYDAYIRRQRMIVEMERMVSRPFSSALLEIRQTDESDNKKEPPDIRRRKKPADHPSAIAIEPIHGQKAAVLSVILQLPTVDESYPPPNSSGICIASAFVSLGHNRKQSFEKSSDKLKRKYAPRSNMDTCI